MVLRIGSFSGIAPKVAEHLLPDGAAVMAENCRLVGGEIGSWSVPQTVETPAVQSSWPPYQSLYRYQPAGLRASGQAYYLTWLKEVQAVPSPISNDVYDRVYFTGDDFPKVTSSDIVNVGTGAFPKTSYRVGIPAPVQIPVLAITGTASPDPPDPTTGIDRVAVITFVNTYGEESAPSPVSNSVTVYPGQTVRVSLADYTTTEPYATTYRPLEEIRLYLSNTGTSGTEFQFVESLAPGTVTYDMTYDFAAFGEVLGTTGWVPPPSDLIGLIALPWGGFAGFRPSSTATGLGNSVYLSVPYQPHAWPEEYSFTVVDTIVALAVFGNMILVLTEGFPTVATGNDPTSLSIERLEIGYSCTSRRGVVDLGGQILYPCPQGLASVGLNGSGLATEKLLTEREWASFYPYTIHAHLHNGNYVGFFDASYAYSTSSLYVDYDYVAEGYVSGDESLQRFIEAGFHEEGFYETVASSAFGYESPRSEATPRGGFVFNPTSGQFTTFDGYEFTAGHSYAGGNRLLLHQYPESTLVHFDAGATRMPYTWKSKLYMTADAFHPMVMRVDADSYPVTVKLYENEVLQYTGSAVSAIPQRLPYGLKGRKWQVQVEGTPEVKSVDFATSLEEMGQ